MSDYNSSLPVRTEANGDIVVKLVDGTNVAQAAAIDANGSVAALLKDGSGADLIGQKVSASSLPVVIASDQSDIKVDLHDGAGTALTSQLNGAQQALDVGINVAGAQIDPRSIRALTSSDVVTAEQGTAASLAGAWPTKITDGTNSAAVSASGELSVQVTQPLPAGTNTIGSIASITNALPAGTNTLGKIELTDGTNGPVAVKAASTAAGASDPSLVVALSPNSPLPAGSNALGSILANLQVSNAAVTVSNPVPVTISSATPGLAVQDYHTSVALAASASVTFTYTVGAGKTLSLERIWASASGKIKIEAKNGGTTFMVGFNSTSNPNIDFTVIAPPSVAAASTVTVTVTNEDKAAMDVYATIEGNLN